MRNQTLAQNGKHKSHHFNTQKLCTLTHPHKHPPSPPIFPQTRAHFTVLLDSCIHIQTLAHYITDSHPPHPQSNSLTGGPRIHTLLMNPHMNSLTQSTPSTCTMTDSQPHGHWLSLTWLRTPHNYGSGIDHCWSMTKWTIEMPRTCSKVWSETQSKVH